MAKLIKQRAGCYRLRLSYRRFAQFVRGRYTDNPKWGEDFRPSAGGRHWLIELRDPDTGSLIRYAGIYASLREAVSAALTLDKPWNEEEETNDA